MAAYLDAMLVCSLESYSVVWKDKKMAGCLDLHLVGWMGYWSVVLLDSKMVDNSDMHLVVLSDERLVAS